MLHSAHTHAPTPTTLPDAAADPRASPFHISVSQLDSGRAGNSIQGTMASPAAAAPQVELPTHQLQAIAFHLYSKCNEQTDAFQECIKSATKPSQQCQAEYKALSSCAKEL